MSHTVIVAAKRTAIGSFAGVFANTPAPQLAACVIKGLLIESGLGHDEIQEVILGQVLTAGVGQSPARQAIINAGLSTKTSALTLNKVCGSGLKAIMLADQAIRAGDTQIAIAGGMENMSLAPYAMPKARSGLRLGNATLEDLLIKDGLWDPYSNRHMGLIGEDCAKEFKITREQQDAYAKLSYQRAQAAIQEGRFVNEIAPVPIEGKKGEVTLVSIDEEPSRGDVEKLTKLKAAFEKDGTITAGNASSINDGAAAVLLMSDSKAKEKGLKPLARIVATSQASQDPGWFTTAPALAIKQVLAKAGLKSKDIDLWEINEAFAVVSLYNNQACDVPIEKCNVNGGAVALGHPIGASGARVLVTLVHEMQKRADAKFGLASLCIGGGEAVAMIVEKI